MALTAGAVLVHGYHGGAEDAEIYLPGVLKQLNPSLFPWNTRFFDSHAGMTLFSAAGCGIHPAGASSRGNRAAAMAHRDHFRASIRVLPYRAALFAGEARGVVRRGCGGIAAHPADRGHGTLHHGSVRHVEIFFHRGIHAGIGRHSGKTVGDVRVWIAFTALVHPLMSLFLLVLVGALLLPGRSWKWQPAFYGILPSESVSADVGRLSHLARIAFVFLPHQLVVV